MQQVKLNRATRRWIKKNKGVVTMSDEKQTAQEAFQTYWNECAKLGDLTLAKQLTDERSKELDSQIATQKATVAKLNRAVKDARDAEAAAKGTDIAPSEGKQADAQP